MNDLDKALVTLFEDGYNDLLREVAEYGYVRYGPAENNADCIDFDNYWSECTLPWREELIREYYEPDAGETIGAGEWWLYRHYRWKDHNEPPIHIARKWATYTVE